MRWTLLAAGAAIAASLWLPGEAAQPAPQAGTAGVAGDSITFEQYRDWRLNYIERRRSELAIQLAAGNLPARQKAQLEQVKAYYEWLAGLPEAERDRRFRERFDRIDANHDGAIDAAERSIWHDKQRAFYRRDHGTPQSPAEAAAQ
jgi:hypothetical protein